MKKVFVCSPLKGDISKNQENTRRYCQFVVNEGCSPYAPHILLTQFLDDNNPEHRQVGINCGLAFLEVCDELWYFGGVITEGMQKEINRAHEFNIPVRWYDYYEIKGNY